MFKYNAKTSQVYGNRLNALWRITAWVLQCIGINCESAEYESELIFLVIHHGHSTF